MTRARVVTAAWGLVGLGLIVSLSAAPLAAQSAPVAKPAAKPAPLYMPRAVKRAFTDGTRSPDGRPGRRYWQNHGRYTITVTATPPDRKITGTERIVYVNDSPDTLSRLVIKLLLNIHKPGAPRFGAAQDAFLTSGVHVDAFTVNGQARPWTDDPRYFTWQPVALPAPLLPHDSVALAFDWHYDLAPKPDREGVIDSTTFFLAYFYPRVAVYDDYNGWDTMDHADHEFYSDFNDYDVTVRVPANYVVWGTGTLHDPETVLQAEPLKRFQASFTSDTTIHVATRAELAARSITRSQTVNSWRFTANDIADVALALSDHYDWDAASVVVDSAAHRRASVQATYNDTAADFHRMVQFGRHALDWFSREWPGVPYPYEKTTIFQGGAGMEYPMMVNDEAYADTNFARFVAEHEIAHTYFPFYMGINETRYAFMDEGWATTFEHLVAHADIGQESADSLFQQFRVKRWIGDPSPLGDLPIITPADVTQGLAYSINAYGKPALGYLAVKDLLGDALFRRCLHAFIDRWHGKHPIPWDFFNTFNDVAGQSLNWFWRNWYFSNGYIDLAVTGVRKTTGGYAVTVDNVGGLATPFDLRLRYGDGSTETVHQTPAVWKAGGKTVTLTVRTARTAVRSVEADGGIFMDADTSNNRWRAGR